jgi:hypothetical protein
MGSQSASDYLHLDFNLNLDRSFFTQQLLTNNENLNVYFKNLVLQAHLAWSYFYHEHRIQLHFSKINVTAKQKLFNIDPQPALTLQKHYERLMLQSQAQPAQNQIYLLPFANVAASETQDGVASHSSISLCTFNNTNTNTNTKSGSSLILIRERRVTQLLKRRQVAAYAAGSSSWHKQRYLLLSDAIEQSNLLIDLIGINLGNRIEQNLTRACKRSNEFNWYFQILSVGDEQAANEQSDEIESNETEYAMMHDAVCINRMIRTEECRPDEANQPIRCGNGIVEAQEQCDCEPSDLRCLKCCDSNTCLFRMSHFQCAVSFYFLD